MRILGIETSCDETGIAVFDEKEGLLGHILHSQVAIHSFYGGVVPELASRDHICKITPLLQSLFTQYHIDPFSIDGIAYTKGPGLIGALLVGAAFAKGLALAWNIPAIGIHHMEGHLLAVMLEGNTPKFPFIALLVSGGHTLLVEVFDVGQYRVLGESLDDAAGEAFDKTAKLLNLGYPGGPALAALAESGTPKRFYFPRPLTEKPGLDFSFSGLKTFTMNTFKNTSQTPQDKADVAFAFQEAIVETLVIKCKRALITHHHKRLVVAGGVGANQYLRKKLNELSNILNISIYFPRLEFCTDNGAMIAYAGYHRFKERTQESMNIEVQAKWPIDTL